jgi:predicted PurR-regulated permease PerM
MFLANLVLIPVVSFYLMRDWHQVVAWGRSLIPERWAERLDDFLVEADQALGAFLRGQVLVMLALAVIYTLGYTIVGVPQAVLVGFFAGTMNFVPYLGHVMAFLAAVGSLLVSGQMGWSEVLGVVAVLAVGQAMEQWFLTPRLVGERIGMHPVAVMFALLAGGELFGFTGVLLALPASAVAGVVVRHVRLWWHEDGSRLKT